MSDPVVETPPSPEPSLGQSVLRSAIGLAMFAVLTAGIIALTQSATKDRIAEQIRQSQLRSLAQIVPPAMHDNDLLQDSFMIAATGTLALKEGAEAFIAKRDGQTVAVILPVVAKEGYTGPIRLMVGIAPNGEVVGVRVVEHKETPGLGDKIESKKSDWILSFNGRTLDNPSEEGWRVNKDGGEFDALTGATITPRAVVKAVHTALKFFSAHREALTQALPGQMLHLEANDGAK